MKSKAEKIKEIEIGIANLAKSHTVIFTDFTGLATGELNGFRRLLQEAGATFQVIKKRLLRFVLQKQDIILDPKQLKGQTGVVFSSKDLPETAALVYKFTKGKKESFKILGGFDLEGKKFIEAVIVQKIGQLPSREVLLGQLFGVLAAPLRQFMWVLQERSKKVVS